MKVQVLNCLEKNSGQLIQEGELAIEIKKGRFIYNDTSHPLYTVNEKYFIRTYCLEYLKKRIYYFNRFGNSDGNTGFYVGFSWLQHQRFLLLQNRHWLQKEESVRYIVNLVFLILGAYIGLKNLK